MIVTTPYLTRWVNRLDNADSRRRVALLGIAEVGFVPVDSDNAHCKALDVDWNQNLTEKFVSAVASRW